MISGDRKLWLGVSLGFCLLLGAWTILFVVAANNRVAEVPLAHKTPGATTASPAR
ncbi:MAG: hypothetical protein QM760_17375 [Nibricoccus sp.]